jgi:hypothetical protein
MERIISDMTSHFCVANAAYECWKLSYQFHHPLYAFVQVPAMTSAYSSVAVRLLAEPAT